MCERGSPYEKTIGWVDIFFFCWLEKAGSKVELQIEEEKKLEHLVIGRQKKIYSSYLTWVIMISTEKMFKHLGQKKWKLV